MKRLIGAALLGLLTLSACGTAGGGADEQPTSGASVHSVTTDVDKFCDGQTLVYVSYKEGLAVIPNSSECSGG